MLLLLVCSGNRPAPVQAQSIVFTNLTQVKVTPLSNGLRIEFNFDGTFRFNTPLEDYLIFNNDGPVVVKPVDVIKFSLPNARTQVGAFVNVSRYPVSHVEISVPPQAPEGVGLDVAIPLMAPAGLRGIRTRGYNAEGWDLPTPPSFSIHGSTDGRQLIVTVISDRLQAGPEARKTEDEASKLPHELTVADDNGSIRLTAINTGLRPVLVALSALTGVRIVLDDTVDRIVNANMPTTSLDELLDDLARAYGLALVSTADGYLLTDAEPSQGARLTAFSTATVRLKYVSAANAIDLLPDFLRPLLRVSAETNSIIISGAAPLVAKIRADLLRLDRPAPQVALDVLAVESSRTLALDAGLGLSFTGPWMGSVSGSTGDISFSTLSQSQRDLNAQLTAIASREHVRIRAQPRLTLAVGEKGSLFVGQQQLIIVGSNQDFGVVGQLQEVDLGTRLDVQAWSGPKGPVTLLLQPEVTTLISKDPATGLPVTQRRNATSMLRVADGETVVIGGLRQTLAFPRRRKIPLLGDLPLIGSLFRSVSHQRTISDLTFLITVHLIPPTGTPAA